MEFTDYPLTHSLAATVVWALLAGAVYYSWPTKDVAHHGRRAALIMLAVASHWFLDLIVHTPDLPLLSNDSTKLGFGLWRSIPASIAVELAVFGGGLALWMLAPRKHRPAHSGRVLMLAAVLVALWLLSLLTPPPSSVRTMALVGLAAVPVLLLLAWWADRPVPHSHNHTHTHGRK
jgi:hypothetical protein